MENNATSKEDSQSKKEDFDNDTDDSISQLKDTPIRARTYSDKSLTISCTSSNAGRYSSRGVSPYVFKAVDFGPFLPVVLCILFTELCERMTYYGISGNLVVFLNTDLNVESALASSIVLVFTGVSYVVPLFGGWVADSIAGKFNTLYGSILIYLVGTALLPVVAYKFNAVADLPRYIFFAIGLVFVSIGTGGIKANVSPFGAEQLSSLGPSAISVFFNWFYWFINVGSFIAYTGIVWLQINKSFFIGFLVPLAGIFLATIILLSGRKSYICSPPNGSVMTDLCKIMHSATKRKWRLRRAGCLHDETDISWLDYARNKYGGRYSNGQVDTLISLLRILPIFATMILYWTVYMQMQTSFLLQGLNMDLRIGSFTIPAASLGLFDVIVILLLIPLMDRVVYPVMKKIGIKFTPLKRMGAGMVFAILSVIVAAVIEVERRKHVKDGHRHKISGKYYNQSSLTVFYQGPQYVLIGISEVFASISGLEFAYAQSPRVLQGVVMGLFLATSGLGALVGSALVQIVKSASTKYGSKNWYSDDINEGKLDFFFYLLAVLLGVNFLVFCVISMRYTYVSDSVLRKNEEEWTKSIENKEPSYSDEDGYVEKVMSGGLDRT